MKTTIVKTLLKTHRESIQALQDLDLCYIAECERVLAAGLELNGLAVELLADRRESVARRAGYLAKTAPVPAAVPFSHVATPAELRARVVDGVLAVGRFYPLIKHLLAYAGTSAEAVQVQYTAHPSSHSVMRYLPL